jgi:hypothetical protein
MASVSLPTSPFPRLAVGFFGLGTRIGTGLGKVGLAPNTPTAIILTSRDWFSPARRDSPGDL